ncbi:Rnf-Nqr domain containing protein [Pseudomonas gingeri]|uniref:Rnf-Nqr domain containing protein n=1 Tax=Pseudomonas gingeri TaxID=117681 RepID=UPI0015A317EE|nr:Rnf-Nqr domain containing protein [Pseudomonas gingeri]NWD06000.1 hypothetical protein [Pseudomonas gingeri]NWD48950.1 hypothetical protein [Pseudomonas gingeri]NWE32612.1 hypothetical protein [Pseudomonas gingeri]NWE55042.1 hypothetical protein [Pseudomonas gingeri]NWF03342.1 hypothetical protein [Pseudomonas gingeri]
MNNTRWLPGSLMLPFLLGASDLLVKAISLWLASVVVVLIYAVAGRALKPWISTELRWPAHILLAAGSASLASLGLQAWSWELYQALSIYLALLSVQCLALEYLGFFQPGRLNDNIRLFAGFGALMLSLGLLRELLANGTLLDHLQWWTGVASHRAISLFAAENGLHLAARVPGAFLLLGLLLAGKKAWTLRSTSNPVLQRK